MNDSERELFESLNHERAAQSLSALKWDDALFKAARQHALLMLNQNNLEHQLPSEPNLAERLVAAGARFSFIAENIAVGPNPHTIHDGWMNSPGHRKNILNRRVTAVGIAVVRGNNGLFAVEDFSQAFANLSQEQQEKQIISLLTAKGWRVSGAAEEARKSCDSNAGMPGVRGWSVVRFGSTDLSAFSPEIEKKIRSEQFHNVAVGACRTSEAAGFAQYRIALVFY
ncbi:MAG TPA: CAP domain-containing protein [Candidatus Acidoferrum sp.]|nr:CAP domain-containing protein [Candidatus Acidoferrum sp.]